MPKTICKRPMHLAILLMLMFVLQLSPPCAHAQITWVKDVTQALEIARTKRKYVFVLVTNPERCVWCRKLEGEILSNPTVDAFLGKNFVSVKLNSDTEYGKAIKARYGKEGRGIPNMAVLAPSGAKLGAIGGCPATPADFLDSLNRACRGLE